jgi:hypothetical protein
MYYGTVLPVHVCIRVEQNATRWFSVPSSPTRFLGIFSISSNHNIDKLKKYSKRLKSTGTIVPEILENRS